MGQHGVLHITYNSPVGGLEIAASADGVKWIRFIESAIASMAIEHPVIKMCMEQLDLYFNHQLREFTVPLDMQGTPFQKSVWEQVVTIPFGKTASYQDIALKIGNGGSVRAVGNANRVNPVPILIPCHRVIGADGKLTGYAGGLWRKQWLLEHEGAIPARLL
ncbi:methylated-DNA--[protein]-cysteine S-methyltransferase [candidate division KSB1 bacterium]|nr:methylated-DNA--[protein]-cysteine S-methyltransferase [candidate division KSB1 bacterium]